MLLEKSNASQVETPNDELIWSNFKNGDRNALAFIYNKYVGLLYTYGRNVACDEHLVEDVIQELFIGLWKSRKNLCDVNSIKSYLFKSLRRALIKKLKTIRKTRIGLFQEAYENYGVSDSIQETVIRQEEEDEKVKFIQEALDTFGRCKKKSYISSSINQ